jgi:DNA gyrase inhibitor GyrI
LEINNESTCIHTSAMLFFAYIRHIGPYGINNVQTMEELKKWAKFNHLFNDEAIILGIAQDNPEATKPENCRYDTCIVVSSDYSVIDGYVKNW